MDCLKLTTLPALTDPWSCKPCLKAAGLASDLKKFQDLSTKYDSVVAETEKLKKRLQETEKKVANQPKPGTSSSSTNEGEISSLITLQKQLLSRQFLAELPEFSGDPTEWPLFYCQYVESTKQGNLEDGFNICRLRKSLKGPALNAVKGALYLPDNLANVIETLKKRFGNEDTIVNRKLKSFDTIPSPNESKPSTIKGFYEALHDLKATLENLKATKYLDSPQTLSMVVDKLSPSLRRSWVKLTLEDGEKDTLEEFISWFEPFYNCAVVLDEIESKKRDHVSVHQETPQKVKNSDAKKCAFCKNAGHYLPECRKFKKIPLRKKWDFLKRGKWCFCCLSAKHSVDSCPNKRACELEGCKEFHNQLLHPVTPETERNEEGNVGVHKGPQGEICYRIIPVKLSNKDRSVLTWAFLDDGSGMTLMSRKLAAQLNVSGPKSSICLSWTNGATQQDCDSQIVELDISSPEGGKKFRLQNVRTVEKLDLPAPNATLLESLTNYEHLRNLHVPAIPYSSPGILIGLQHAKLTLSYEIREGTWNQPVATLTRLGWAVYGKLGSDSPATSIVATCRVCECTSMDLVQLHDLVKHFFTTESFGVRAVERSPIAKEDAIAQKIFDRTLKKVGNRYEVGLLWREETRLLPNNRAMAYKRLLCLENKLAKDPALKAAVMEKLQSHLQKGYLRKVSEEELAQFKGNIWFLPLFATSNPNKPGKIRMVWDAAAKFEGVCLNDFQITGPDLLVSLFGVLLRFREDLVALTGDIVEMFHQIKVMWEDQFCQLILWRNCVNKRPEIYASTVLTFGSTSSPSCSQHVKNEHARMFIQLFPEAVQAIIEDTYVDDLMTSLRSAEDAISIAQQIRDIYKQGGFEIRNWLSNSPKVMQALNQTSSEPQKTLDLSGADAVEKVLGMFWNIMNDMFLFRLNFNRVDKALIRMERIPTKREMLKVVMSIFDPLGFLVPITIPSKVMIQHAWRAGIEWDQKISPEIEDEWKNWLVCLDNVAKFSVPRCYFEGISNVKAIQLHLFCDASESAFCACAYIRIEYSDGRFAVRFVAAKSKVAPQKALSIPRLELQGAVMASRLSATLRKEMRLKIDECVYWTDSRTVLGWIRSDHRRYTPFVAHRISEILDVSTINQWRWIPTKVNVADDGTKWENVPVISNRWLNGPSFLSTTEWPEEGVRARTTNEELRSTLCATTVTKTLGPWLHPERFSSWTRLHRSLALIIRYFSILYTRIQDPQRKKLEVRNDIKWLRPKRDPHVVNPTTDNIAKAIQESLKYRITPLNGSELKNAELVLLQKCQLESFPDEINLLTNGKSVPKQSDLYELLPTIDKDKLLRATTRLDAVPSGISEDLKSPIILGKTHHITYLIIMSFHLQLHHFGRESVVREIRQRFWIPKIRIQVNRTLRKCNKCQICNAKATTPRMADLPPQRLALNQPAFTYTGMDFFGPLEITVGRHREKRYGVVFTCLTTRGVHIELASSMDTSSCILAVRNFMNRRGPPLQIWSDNGTNLRGAEKELREAFEAIDKTQLVDRTQSKSPHPTYVEWKFNPPSASHFGGAWERMVGLIKRPLYQMLKSRAPKEETLRSLLIEIENLINSRPLNYSSSADGSPEPTITPNHFLRLTDRQVTQPGNFLIADYRKQWRVCQELTSEYWNRFLLDYLPNISTRSKWFSEVKPITIGQVVLIIDETLKRGEWKKAIVTATHPSKDGRIRTVTVRTATSSFLRPVTKLAIININEDNGFV